MNTANSPTPGAAAEDPVVAKLKLEVEKLAFEINELKSEGAWVRRVNRLLPVITGLLAVAGFWFGIIQYLHAEKESLAHQQNEFLREIAKPMWDKRIAIFIEATETTATIATVKDRNSEKFVKAEARFWELYWGPMAAVEGVAEFKKESAGIETAMVNFGDELKKKDNASANKLQRLSLSLAHEVRTAIAPTFKVPGP